MRESDTVIMVTRKTVMGVGLLGLVALIAACGTRAAVDTPAARPVLRLSMRTNDMLTAFLSLSDFSIRAVESGNSEQRLKALQDGKIDVASVVADVTYVAFTGSMPDGSAPLQRIRGIALMNRAVVQLLVGPNVDARQGFRGMRIVLGDPTGGNASLGERLVNMSGVPTSQIHGEFATYDAAADKLLSGDVDAAFITGMPPQAPVARALHGGARLVEINGPEVDRLRAYYPLLRRTLLPRGTYPRQEAPLHTVGVDLLLICRADLDSDVVYALTRALFEKLPENIRRQIDPQRAPATVIPLHAGAARYYRERELRR